MFATIIVSLLLGYTKGINTKRKKIIAENKTLKKDLALMKRELKKVKSIKYDYQVNTGAFMKKSADIFRNDIELTVKLDRNTYKQYLALIGILSESSLCYSDEKFNISILQNKLTEIEQSKDVMEFDFNSNSIVLDIWEVRESLEELFNRTINISEYDLSFSSAYDSLSTALKEINHGEEGTFKKIRRAVARDN